MGGGGRFPTTASTTLSSDTAAVSADGGSVLSLRRGAACGQGLLLTWDISPS